MQPNHRKVGSDNCLLTLISTEHFGLVEKDTDSKEWKIKGLTHCSRREESRPLYNITVQSDCLKRWWRTTKPANISISHGRMQVLLSWLSACDASCAILCQSGEQRIRESVRFKQQWVWDTSFVYHVKDKYHINMYIFQRLVDVSGMTWHIRVIIPV
jgi:hypothetical protein